MDFTSENKCSTCRSKFNFSKPETLQGDLGKVISTVTLTGYEFITAILGTKKLGYYTNSLNFD